VRSKIMSVMSTSAAVRWQSRERSQQRMCKMQHDACSRRGEIFRAQQVNRVRGGNRQRQYRPQRMRQRCVR